MTLLSPRRLEFLAPLTGPYADRDALLTFTHPDALCCVEDVEDELRHQRQEFWSEDREIGDYLLHQMAVDAFDDGVRTYQQLMCWLNQ